MKAQTDEWRELKLVALSFSASAFAAGGGESGQRRFLPLDTRHFPKLEADILASFPDLDGALDGEFWKSENWQALNALKKRYAGRVKCIYIDPPFNLGGSDQFDYRTSYKDSSWATMLENRLTLARDFLSDDGAIFARCDYNGSHILRFLMDDVYGAENFKNTIALGKSARITEEIRRYHSNFDYLYFYAKKEKKCVFRAVGLSRKERKWQPMHLPGVRWSPIDAERVALFSPENIREENGKHTTRARIILGKEMLPPEGRHWALSQESVFEREARGEIRASAGNGPQTIQSESQMLTDNWTDHVGYSSDWDFQTENHEEILRRVIETCSLAENIVMDFFAGSGTAQAVAQKLGRKWLGVEMGAHFDTVILPRMKKVLAGHRSGINSKNGNGKNGKNGNGCDYAGGGFFKYGEFEQYEETLRHSHYGGGDSDLWDAGRAGLRKYVFFADGKLSRAAQVAKDKIKIKPDEVCPGADIAETVANIVGKRIKSRGANSVTFTDGKTLSLDTSKMDEDALLRFIDILRPCLWWGEE